MSAHLKRFTYCVVIFKGKVLHLCSGLILLLYMVSEILDLKYIQNLERWGVCVWGGVGFFKFSSLTLKLETVLSLYMLNNNILLVTQSNYLFQRVSACWLYHQNPYFSYGVQVLMAFLWCPHHGNQKFQKHFKKKKKGNGCAVMVCED